jgi:hypothetical protein
LQSRKKFFHKFGAEWYRQQVDSIVSMPGYEGVARKTDTSKQQEAKITSRLPLKSQYVISANPRVRRGSKSSLRPYVWLGRN